MCRSKDTYIKQNKLCLNWISCEEFYERKNLAGEMEFNTRNGGYINSVVELSGGERRTVLSIGRLGIVIEKMQTLY